MIKIKPKQFSATFTFTFSNEEIWCAQLEDHFNGKGYGFTRHLEKEFKDFKRNSKKYKRDLKKIIYGE